jgi:hypothetical protein
VPYPKIETEHSSGTIRKGVGTLYRHFPQRSDLVTAVFRTPAIRPSALPAYFMQRLGPALGSLLEAATASGEIRGGISAKD